MEKEDQVEKEIGLVVDRLTSWLEQFTLVKAMTASKRVCPKCDEVAQCAAFC